MKEPITPLFNQLSLIDRFSLKSASMFVAITTMAREDTKENPWRYPGYASFLALVLAPIPLPGSNIIPIALFFAVARTRMTPWARMADDRMMASIKNENVMEAYKHLIHPHRQNPQRYHVDNIQLAKETARTTVGDVYDATRYAWRSLRRAFT